MSTPTAVLGAHATRRRQSLWGPWILGMEIGWVGLGQSLLHLVDSPVVVRAHVLGLSWKSWESAALVAMRWVLVAELVSCGWIGHLQVAMHWLVAYVWELVFATLPVAQYWARLSSGVWQAVSSDCFAMVQIGLTAVGSILVAPQNWPVVAVLLSEGLWRLWLHTSPTWLWWPLLRLASYLSLAVFPCWCGWLGWFVQWIGIHLLLYR